MSGLRSTVSLIVQRMRLSCQWLSPITLRVAERTFLPSGGGGVVVGVWGERVEEKRKYNEKGI